MTPEALEAIGCAKIHWNPELSSGGFFEYYLPVYGDGRSWEITRLSVTFGGFEGPEHDYLAWIVSPNHRLGLMHVRTIEQFQQMYELLTGKRQE